MQKYKVGDVVEHINDSFLKVPIGTRGTVLSISDGSWVEVRVMGGPSAEQEQWWVTENIRLFNNPIEEAKKLLESNGYKVELPINRVLFDGINNTRVGVYPEGARFSKEIHTLIPATMDKLVEAWVQVKAEEVRRNTPS